MNSKLQAQFQERTLSGQRQTNFDVVRVFACVAVITAHVSTWVIYNNPSLENPQWWISNFFDAAMRWPVPVFIMVTGALLIPKARATTVQNFWRQRLPRVIVLAVSWSGIYVFISHFITHNLNHVGFMLAAMGDQPFYHLWYLYLAILLYILIPFVQKALDRIGLQSIVLMIILSLVISTVAGWPEFGGRYTAFTVFAYVAYLAIGYIVCNLPKLSKRGFIINSAIVCLCWMTSSALSAVLLPRFGSAGWEFMFSMTQGLVAIMAIAVIRLLLSIEWQFNVAPLARLTLGIYAVHPLWVLALSKIDITGFTFGPALGIPLTSALVFWLSAATAFLLSKVKVLRAVVS